MVSKANIKIGSSIVVQGASLKAKNNLVWLYNIVTLHLMVKNYTKTKDYNHETI